MMKDEEGMPGFPSVSSWTHVQRHLLRLERDEEKASILDTIEKLPAQVGGCASWNSTPLTDPCTVSW